MSEGTAITTKENCSCKKQQTRRVKNTLPIVLSVIIAILPKCPFCILGYSSVMTLCSGVHTTFLPSVGGYFPIIISLVVVSSFFLNYKGQRTLVALFLAIVASLFIGVACFVNGGASLYYIGVMLLFAGVLYNGKWLYYQRFLKEKLSAFGG
jgi:uncharacterized membrane protein YczE